MNALIIRDDIGQVWFSPEGREGRDVALASSALIGKVANAEDQDQAVKAQTDLQRIVVEVEKARKEVKEPVLKLGKRIDDTAREFVSECEQELLRLARLLGDYQALEGAKARAAEQAKSEKLTQLERDKATEAAQATSHEQLEAIHERYNDKAALIANAPAPLPHRANGQVVKADWEIKVSDVWLLARTHPTCVNIEPRISEIKSLLNAGVNLPGVTAERITTSSVRLKPQRAIDV